jgi:hypothetical protein
VEVFRAHNCSRQAQHFSQLIPCQRAQLAEGGDGRAVLLQLGNYRPHVAGHNERCLQSCIDFNDQGIKVEGRAAGMHPRWRVWDVLRAREK